jgi:hypothetical protein
LAAENTGDPVAQTLQEYGVNPRIPEGADGAQESWKGVQGWEGSILGFWRWCRGWLVAAQDPESVLVLSLTVDVPKEGEGGRAVRQKDRQRFGTCMENRGGRRHEH